MSFIGNQQAKVWRRTEGGVDLATGIATADTFADQGLIDITINPVTGEELSILPEGDRLADWRKGFTTVELEVSDDQVDGVDGDVIEFDGFFFEIRHRQHYQRVIPHYRVLMRRVDRPFSPT